MQIPTETALFAACRTLFGSEVQLSRDFLSYLQPSGAKSAFRALAKSHHPDFYAGSEPHVQQQQNERFREILKAYDLISDFLENRKFFRKARPAQRRAPGAGAQRSRHSTRTQPKTGTRPHGTAVPWIALEFGMYAYYLGKISYQDLIEALVWQRRQRPIIGEVARKWGWLSEEKIKEILRYRGRSSRFGKKAVELGYLRPYQVKVLLQHQRSSQQRIGRYFVEKGLLTEEDADAISDELRSHNDRVAKNNGRRAGSRP